MTPGSQELTYLLSHSVLTGLLPELELLVLGLTILTLGPSYHSLLSLSYWKWTIALTLPKSERFLCLRASSKTSQRSISVHGILSHERESFLPAFVCTERLLQYHR